MAAIDKRLVSRLFWVSVGVGVIGTAFLVVFLSKDVMPLRQVLGYLVIALGIMAYFAYSVFLGKLLPDPRSAADNPIEFRSRFKRFSSTAGRTFIVAAVIAFALALVSERSRVPFLSVGIVGAILGGYLLLVARGIKTQS